MEAIKIDDVKFTNTNDFCINIATTSRVCTFSNITSENYKKGILVNGTNHLFQKIRLSNSTHDKGNGDIAGIVFRGGNNHTLEDFTCTGNTTDSAWDLEIHSTNTTVKNSTCDNVLVTGEGASLNIVESRNLIRIEGNPQGIQLVKCKSKNLEATGTVTMTTCNFGSGSS